MVATNPGSIVELGHSSDGHFEQLFVAHSVSIQGFAMGCRPIIAIDSAHMSGPYREVVGDKEVVIISDRHPALLRSVPEVFGLENHAYCYRHLKENFSSFLSKHNTRGNKGKENALQFLDSIAYARLEHDYNVSMFELRKYNDALAKWVEENEPEHWAMSKFPKQRWDKMTTNLAESFNAWLRNERHHSICTFLMEHMAKLGSMLVKHKEESNNWKGCIGQKLKKKCSRKLPRNVVDFVQDWYKFPMQELIYSGSFSGIETHDMPMVANDGLVRSITGEVFLSLNPPHTKRPPGRPRKKRIESNFKINGLSLAQDVILPGTTGKHATSTPYIAIVTVMLHSQSLADKGRRSHVPSRSEAVKLPKSRCSGKKFLSIMDTLPMDKKNAIGDMGFGGLLQLGCKELRYELITWIVANYDIGYHRLCMETKVVVPVMPKDVRRCWASRTMALTFSSTIGVAHPTAHTTSKYWKLICVIYQLAKNS
ncbi:hypothetical protein CK203_113603 [Vitis vinifera]|uniref:MULE transposase domain-containing protein n=1 Tax=Vitis vinifera TaxID=29760 RepID=A0A438C9T8_VITVI|nr:hypothetical protein CK203_113603 [Vitis vinifera]